MDYPSDCVIEFNPKSRRDEGDIAFKSPGGYKIFLSWGPLKKVEKLHGVEGHADYSIERIRKSREARVKDVRRETVRVKGHAASFNEVKLELIKRGLYFNKKVTPQDVRSLHTHCDVSSRYFVLYSPMAAEKSLEQGDIVASMMKTLSCHGPIGE